MPKYGFCSNNKIQCVRQSSRGGGGVRRNMFSAFTQTNIDNTYTPGSGVGAVSRANRRALLRRAANKKCCFVKKEEQDPFFLVFYDSTLGEWYIQSLKADYSSGSVRITLKQFNETYTEISGNLIILDGSEECKILLKKVSGYISLVNLQNLPSILFPNLTMSAFITIKNCSKLTSIDFPELLKVSEGISFSNNSSVTNINCLKLYSAGIIYIYQNQNLSINNIYFPQLTTADVIYIYNNLLGQTRADSFKSIGLLSNNEGVKNISGTELAVFINSICTPSVDYLKTIFISGQTVNGNISIAP